MRGVNLRPLVQANAKNYSGSWMPASLSGFVVHYDPDDPNMVVDGDGVGDWPNSAVGGWDNCLYQATGSKKPELITDWNTDQNGVQPDAVDDIVVNSKHSNHVDSNTLMFDPDNATVHTMALALEVKYTGSWSHLFGGQGNSYPILNLRPAHANGPSLYAQNAGIYLAGEAGGGVDADHCPLDTATVVVLAMDPVTFEMHCMIGGSDRSTGNILPLDKNINFDNWCGRSHVGGNPAVLGDLLVWTGYHWGEAANISQWLANENGISL